MELAGERRDRPGGLNALRGSAGHRSAIAVTIAGAALFAFIAISMILRGGAAIYPGWSTRWTTGGIAAGELGASEAFTGAGAGALGWTDGASGAAGSEEIGAPRPRRGVRRGALRWMEGVAPAAG